MKQVVCVGGLVSALCFVTLAQGQNAEAGWAKMTQCAAIRDDEARHTCTDNALRDAGLLTEETTAGAKSKAFGLQKSSEPKKSEKEHLEVTLAKVDHGGDGKLLLTTADGAVWHQVEGVAISQMPKAGDVMKIEARSLGSFMCQPSKYVSFRCYRSK